MREIVGSCSPEPLPAPRQSEQAARCRNPCDGGGEKRRDETKRKRKTNDRNDKPKIIHRKRKTEQKKRKNEKKTKNEKQNGGFCGCLLVVGVLT